MGIAGKKGEVLLEFTEEIRNRFMKVSPAAIGHHIAGGFMKAEIKPVTDEMKVVGPAYTVRLTERDSSALYYAEIILLPVWENFWRKWQRDAAWQELWWTDRPQTSWH